MNNTENSRAATGVVQDLVLRGLDPEADIARFLRLMTEIDKLDGINLVRTEQELREFITRPHSDPRHDRWVIADPDDGDRLIASGYIYKTPTSTDAFTMITVHPDWRNKGIGSAIMERIFARATELGATALVSSVDFRRPFGEQFAEHRGFSRVGIDVEMLAPAEVQLDEPSLPNGYTVRSYDQVNSPEIMLEAINRGFIGHHGHSDSTIEEVQHWLSSASMQPEGIFIAFGREGDVAGICWAEISESRTARRGEPTGYIDSLAVVPEHRRHGLGRALLLIGMRWLRENGQGPIELDAWGANEKALPLYEGVGFSTFRQMTEYRRELGTS